MSKYLKCGNMGNTTVLGAFLDIEEVLERIHGHAMTQAVICWSLTVEARL
jgi:hypothetical protein